MVQISSRNIISNDLWHQRKMYNFAPYNVFLSIATNILQRLKTGFVVVQGHIWSFVPCLVTRETDRRGRDPSGDK